MSDLKLDARERILLNIEAAAELLVALGDWYWANKDHSATRALLASDDPETPENKRRAVENLLAAQRSQAALRHICDAEKKHAKFLSDMATFAGGC